MPSSSMRRLLYPPPLYVTIYQAALCVLASVIALLWASDLPVWVRLPLMVANLCISARVAWLWWRAVRNRRRGGY